MILCDQILVGDAQTICFSGPRKGTQAYGQYAELKPIRFGPSAFADVIYGFRDDGPAMRRKPLREFRAAISWRMGN